MSECFLINNLFQILPKCKTRNGKMNYARNNDDFKSNTLINYFCIFNKVYANEATHCYHIVTTGIPQVSTTHYHRITT